MKLTMGERQSRREVEIKFVRSGRGLYSPLFREKPPEKKLLLLADFIKKLGPFYKKLNFGNLYRPKSQKVRKCQMQSLIRTCAATLL